MKVEDVEDDHHNGHLKNNLKEKVEINYNEDEEKNDEGKNEKDKKEEKKPVETVGLFELFKFADKLDVILIVLGIISGITCGCIFSVMFIMFGNVTDVLAQYDSSAGVGSGNEAFLEGMNSFAKQISWVGLG